jgi:molybdopterin molybdotransferase
MLSVEDARAQILDGFEALPIVEVPIAEACGMVTAEDVFAPHDLPRFDNSAMDGYAVRRADIPSPGSTLELIGEVRAGAPGDQQVGPGAAARVMTGAPIPPGADAVVPIEQAEESGGRVTIVVVPADHAHIRPAGDDVKAGDPIVRAGTELESAELAILASLGLSPARVHRRPEVVVLSTGDELVAPEAEPAAGQIRDSNSVALRALVEEAGAVPRVIGPVADDKEAVRDALLDAATTADLIVSSGGVSVGRYDFVKEVIEEVGALDLWRVAMQPGKPLVSGRVGEVPFLGLPGNPVSIHIGFEQFVRPALRKLRGCSQLLRPTITARLGAPVEKRPGRLHFVRVRLSFDDEGVVATPTGSQGSHIQSSLLDCHGVARFGIDESVLDEGAEVVVEVWKLP